jgi:hypothetical protein
MTGYGREPDGTVACPRRGPELPCAARDGRAAITTPAPSPWPGSVCRGCGQRPLALLEALAREWRPGRDYLRTHRMSAAGDADRLAEAAARAARAAGQEAAG